MPDHRCKSLSTLPWHVLQHHQKWFTIERIHGRRSLNGDRLAKSAKVEASFFDLCHTSRLCWRCLYGSVSKEKYKIFNFIKYEINTLLVSQVNILFKKARQWMESGFIPSHPPSLSPRKKLSEICPYGIQYFLSLPLSLSLSHTHIGILKCIGKDKLHTLSLSLSLSLSHTHTLVFSNALVKINYILIIEIIVLLASDTTSHTTRGDPFTRKDRPRSTRSFSMRGLCLSTSLESPTSMCTMNCVLVSINTAVDLFALKPICSTYQRVG